MMVLPKENRVSQRDGDDASPIICSNCGYKCPPNARFCAGCGWLLETKPKGPAQGPFESGRLLVLDALQRERLEEACRFLDRQVQAGTQSLDQQLQIAAQKLASLAHGWRTQEQTGGALSQIQPKLSGLVTQVASSFRSAEGPAGVQSPLFCLRCGAENRPQGRFCLHCGAPLTDITPQIGLRLVAGLASDTGLLREINEDRVQLWTADVEGHPVWLAALADGMGGEKAGEIASGMVMEVVAERWRAIVTGQALSGKEESVLIEAVQEANRRVHRAGKTVAGREGMGTTATLLLAWKGTAYLANVGDSRAYLFGTDGRINQITQDHSLVAVLVAIGQITPEEAEHHDQRNLLYRSIGREPSVDVDTFVRRLEPGDRLLLCSDGLTLYLQDQEMAAIVNRGQPPAQICQQLIALANERGGEDNISAILLAVEKSQATLEGKGGAEEAVQPPGGGSEEGTHVQG